MHNHPHRKRALIILASAGGILLALLVGVYLYTQTTISIGADDGGSKIGSRLGSSSAP
jgi:hypothetical protein